MSQTKNHSDKEGFSQLLTNTRLKILQYLNTITESASFYTIAKAINVSPPEVYRQIKVFVDLGLISEEKRGIKKINYIMNRENPITMWLIQIGTFLDVIALNDLLKALNKSNVKYYISGYYIFSLNKKDRLIVVEEKNELIKAIINAFHRQLESVQILYVPKEEFSARSFHLLEASLDDDPTVYQVATVEQALLDGLAVNDLNIVQLLLGKSNLRVTFDINLLNKMNCDQISRREDIASKLVYLGIIRQALGMNWSRVCLNFHKNRVKTEFREIVYKIFKQHPVQLNPASYQDAKIWQRTFYTPRTILKHAAMLGVPEELIEHSLYFYETLVAITNRFNQLEQIQENYLIQGQAINNLLYVDPSIIRFSDDVSFEVHKNYTDLIILAFADLQDELFITTHTIHVLESGSDFLPIGGITIEKEEEGFIITRLVGTFWAGRLIPSDIKRPFERVLEIPIRINLRDSLPERHSVEIPPYFYPTLTPESSLLSITTLKENTLQNLSLEMSFEPVSVYNIGKWIDVALMRMHNLQITVPSNFLAEIEDQEDEMYLRYQLDPSFILTRRKLDWGDILYYLTMEGG